MKISFFQRSDERRQVAFHGRKPPWNRKIFRENRSFRPGNPNGVCCAQDHRGDAVGIFAPGLFISPPGVRFEKEQIPDDPVQVLRDESAVCGAEVPPTPEEVTNDPVNRLTGSPDQIEELHHMPEER
jgi:hypothetical protein